MPTVLDGVRDLYLPGKSGFWCKQYGFICLQFSNTTCNSYSCLLVCREWVEVNLRGNNIVSVTVRDVIRRRDKRYWCFGFRDCVVFVSNGREV